MFASNNSIRLQKLTKTMDLHSHRSSSVIDSHTQMVKLPTLRAINKSVKYNDLSFATSRNLSKLRKEPDQPENIEEMAVHQSLVVVRKKYDNMSKNLQQYQKVVDALQKEHEKLKAEQATFQTAKTQGKARVSSLQEELRTIKLHLEESQIDRKVMQSMTSRLKSDKIVYDLRKYNMEKDLTQYFKAKQFIIKEHQKHKEENYKIQKVKDKLLSHLEEQKRERNAHVLSVTGMVSEKEDIVNSAEVRKLQMRQVALNTLQDKSKEEKNWEKVYLCHRLVQKLLRDKMTREMIKFNVVQVAFKNIKTSTGVDSADALVKKFLSKESTYGDLLGKITQNQRIIADLKREGEELRKQEVQIKVEQEQLNTNKKELHDLSQQQKEMKSMSEKCLKCYTYLQKMDAWLSRNLKKFELSETQSQDPLQQTTTTSSQMVLRFKVYLQTLKNCVQEMPEISEDRQQFGSPNNTNNFRIKFEQGQTIQENDKRHNEDQVEGEYINHQRDNVLKNNDKFMKDLKRKYQQIKKAIIDAQPKKKQVIPDRPKQATPLVDE